MPIPKRAETQPEIWQKEIIISAAFSPPVSGGALDCPVDVLRPVFALQDPSQSADREAASKRESQQQKPNKIQKILQQKTEYT